MNLTVAWSYEEAGADPASKSGGIVSYVVDLKTILPEMVSVGISATTGPDSEGRVVSSWEFRSSLELDIPNNDNDKKIKKRNWKLIFGGNSNTGYPGLCLRFNAVVLVREKEQMFEERNFCCLDERKLGRGGSGFVYKGTLSDLDRQVAVKRIFAESEHSERIFFNKVKVISRVMHRNLVQFVGWKTLPWGVRYKIALGLVSALNHLHEEAEQCVLHRDIKPANVLLDTDFSTKLGDFGVAKFVDPQLRTDRMTAVVGTFGYLALEYVSVGRVWELHLAGNIMEAADERLDNDFDSNQMEALLKVVLWCTNPNERERPKTEQVLKVLQLDAPLPELNQPHDLHCMAELHPVPCQQTTNSFQTANLSPSASIWLVIFCRVEGISLLLFQKLGI
ncbi:hypothetical protein TIFTF001_009495 [Ficus carica]|uniref:Protein kinase domain-containing protein n=1 Tax=Ficus carica TaxID=3494 RepID=A0AA88D1D1_FICCA|nr:hypothetical protein TIFTF001_009495 [Ficus carica]